MSAMDTPSKLKETIIPGDVWEVFAEPLQSGLDVLPTVEGVLRVGLAGDHLRVIAESGLKSDILKQVLDLQGMEVSRVVAGEPTLEDVFLSLAR